MCYFYRKVATMIPVTPEAQYLILVVAVIAALVVIVRRIPAYVDTAMEKRFANDDAKRQQALTDSEIRREDKHAEVSLQIAASDVLTKLGEGVLAMVPVLQKLSDNTNTNGGQLTTLKTDMDNISKTLREGSQPLLDIGTQVKRILEIVQDIQNAPHLTDDKAKRLDDAVAQIGKVTQQLGELVVALQETQADLLRKKHDSQPIHLPEMLDTAASDGKPPQ